MKRKLLSMLLIIVLLALLTSCGCKHEWKDATCIEPQTCTKCGNIQGEALGHKYGGEVTIKEPTCTEPGVKEAICTVCGDRKTIEIPAEHNWVFVATEKTVTCSEEGQEKYKCSICGETKYEALKKLNHQYKDGYCKNCFAEDPRGVKFNPTSDEKKQINKVKTIGDREIKKEDDFYYLLFSFSDEEGNTVIAPCVLEMRIVNDADETVYKAKRIVTTDDYSTWSNAFRKWTLASPKIMRSDIKEGSSSWGTLYFTVRFVDKYFEEYGLGISNLPVHLFAEKEILSQATCGRNGMVRKTCSSCGEVVEEVIPATGRHTYSEEILMEATCGSDGMVRKTCSSCGKIVEEVIPATGDHTFIEEILSQVTCGSDGHKRKICSTCGLVIEDEVTPATGSHIYRKGTVAVEPTCLTEGLMEFHCTVCGYLGRTEKIEKLEHAFENDKCTDCGTLRIGSKGPAGGYIFYDCDLDNKEGNGDGLISSECGWRFLEAAPENIGEAVFGYYRTSPNGKNLFVNGDVKYSEETCTREEIGYGGSNTKMLVDAMENSAYTKDYGAETTDKYAAKMCADYALNGYNDWFLPSKGVLNLMYTNLKENGIGNFKAGDYWSSCEYSDLRAWSQCFYNNGYRCDYGGYDRNCNFYVRPVRAFL